MTCNNCGCTRWRTFVKNIQWGCRDCGHIKNANSETALAIPLPVIAISIDRQTSKPDSNSNSNYMANYTDVLRLLLPYQMLYYTRR